jgi:RIO kinase 1
MDPTRIEGKDMPKRNLLEWFYELEESGDERDLPARAHRGSQPKRIAKPLPEFIEQQDGRESFNFTYKASRFEAAWLLDSLGSFYVNRWIADVLRIVKGGKEASVYLCQGAAAAEHRLLAAKVYRPRSLRNLRNDHLYREGRENLDADGQEIIDDGMLHAMRKKTQYGRELLHTSWIGHEFATLRKLHAAGADVPYPYHSDSNAILMDYIGEDGAPAPPLSSLRLEKEETRPLFERTIHNIELMLSQERIHGDLSAYNILYWEGAITLIDFPQAIHPEQNRNAFRIFERDVVRVCEYFSGQGGEWGTGVRSLSPLHPRKLAADLWTAYRYRLQPEIDPALLDAEDEADVVYWKQLSDR